MHECLHAHIPSHSQTPSCIQLSCMKTVFKTKAFCFKSTGPPLSIKPLDHLRVSNYWTISKNPLLDNPPIEFIRQTSDIIYWTTLRITVTGQPSEYRTTGPSPRTPLLDNPPIGFIGQTSDIIYWITLRITVTGQPSEYRITGPSPRTPLLDNPWIGFIGQTSDIIYWTTLRITVTGQPSEYRTTGPSPRTPYWTILR